MWIASYSVVTNREVFIYDIEKRQILGQVTNGWPEVLFGDPPQLLCSQPARKISHDALRKLITRLSGGRITFAPPQEILTYWLLDLEKDTARLVGEIPGTPNFSFFPSPDFRYCYTARDGRQGREYYLLDLQKRSIDELDAPAHACGWWDNTQLLIQTTNADFLLYDVRQRKTSPLGVGQLAACLLEHSLSVDDMAQVRAFPIWNGREYDFYVTHAHQGGWRRSRFCSSSNGPTAG